MTDTIREQIVKNRITALQQITIANGFDHDLYVTDSGTGTGAAGSLTDGTKAWTANQWVGSTLTDSTNAEFSILSNTATALAVSGTPASGAYTIKNNTVQRFNQAGQNLLKVPLVIVQEDTCEKLAETTEPYIYKRLRLVLHIVSRIDPATDTRSSDEVLNALRGDVERAMHADYTCGGLAEDCEWESDGPLDVELGQPVSGTFMSFIIKYKHQLRNPKGL